MSDVSFNKSLFNDNLTVIGNCVELASMVVANIDSDLISSDMGLELLREAVLEKVQKDFGIKG